MKQIIIVLLLAFILTSCQEPVPIVQDHADKHEAALASPLPTSVKTEQLTSPEIIKDYRQGIQPATITIPSLHVHASVEEVGLLANGRMDDPKGMENVGWFKHGALPGEPGNAVIAGHVDSKSGPAVFFRLKDLDIGDEVIVSDNKGETRTFVVIDMKSYPRNEAPLETIFGFTYRSTLNLITCTGEFNRKARTHEERLVIYTELKQES